MLSCSPDIPWPPGLTTVACWSPGQREATTYMCEPQLRKAPSRWYQASPIKPLAASVRAQANMVAQDEHALAWVDGLQWGHGIDMAWPGVAPSPGC